MSTSPRSPLALAALATVAIPGLDVVATRPRQGAADFDGASLMDSAGRRWTVRSPRHAAAGAALEGEVEILAALAATVDDEQLPFDVARPAGFAPLPEGGRAMVHRELPGRALDVQTISPSLAGALGSTLARIHDLDPDLVAEAGLPVYDAESYRTRRLAELDEAARTGHIPTGLLRRWERALEDVRLWKFIATPVHGDLAGEHILVAEDEVAAILNWAEARVADPADDLAWLIAAADPQAGEQILDSYHRARDGRADEFLAARTLLASELALPRWLMHGVRTRDNGIIDDAIEMLTDLDHAVAEADPIGQAPPVPTDWVTGPLPMLAAAAADDDGAAPEPDSRTQDHGPAGAEAISAGSGPDSAASGPGSAPSGPSSAPSGPGSSPSGPDSAANGPDSRSDYQRAGVDEPTIEGVIVVDSGGQDQYLEPDYERSEADRGDDSPTTQLPSA